MNEVYVIDGYGMSVLVYDVGGSHVSASVCRQDGYRLGPVARGLHPTEPSSEAFVNVLHSLGTQASANFDSVSGAELAMPGPFNYATGISQMTHKMPYLFGVDLRAALAQCFAWQPCKVRFLNDAAAYLLGEVGAGAARNVQRAVCITLGTGVGSGFAVDGHVVTDGLGVPPGGEIWNLPYEGGILEDAISTRAIQGNYQRRTGKLCKVSELAASAKLDPIAAEVFAEFGRHLGQALKCVVSVFAPEVVVLGGGISRSAHLFLPQAQQELNGLPLELRISTLMDQAPLVGAGVAWFDEEAKPAQLDGQVLHASSA